MHLDLEQGEGMTARFYAHQGSDGNWSVLHELPYGEGVTATRVVVGPEYLGERQDDAETIADALEAMEAQDKVKHWREARRTALQAGEILKAEVDRLRLAKDNIRDIVVDLLATSERSTNTLQLVERSLLDKLVKATQG